MDKQVRSLRGGDRLENFLTSAIHHCGDVMWRLARICVGGIFVASLWQGQALAMLQARDLDSLAHAINASIQRAGSGLSWPEEYRKLIILPATGGEMALVFVRPEAADCAALVVGRKTSCRALLMGRVSGGPWELLFTFDQRMFPVMVSLQQGAVKSLWVNSDVENVNRYRQVTLHAGQANLMPGEVTEAEAARKAQWEFDDRNSPVMVTVQRMSALARAPSLLSPARVLSDTINSSTYGLVILAQRRVGPGGSPDERQAKVAAVSENLLQKEVALSESLARTLQADLERLAQRVAWPQALDARLRRCTDWMVPRAFWLTESRRLASPGLCIDVMFWGLEVGRLKAHEQALALARLAMFDDIGAAYASRVLGLTLQDRREWRGPAQLPQFLSLAAGIGAMLATRAGAQSMSERDAAYRLDEVLAEHWYREVERTRGYVEPTPELSRYNETRRLRRQGLACARAEGAHSPLCDAEVSRLLQLAHKEIFR